MLTIRHYDTWVVDARATFNSCKNELRSIINQFTANEEVIRYQFSGIGQFLRNNTNAQYTLIENIIVRLVTTFKQLSLQTYL